MSLADLNKSLYGVSLSSTIEQRKRAVLALSVYQAVSVRGDSPIGSVVAFLRAQWRPGWAPSCEVITNDSVRDAVHLLGPHAVIIDDAIVVPVRDPKTGLGRAMRVDYSAGRVV